jgi:hypothetical protein
LLGPGLAGLIKRERTVIGNLCNVMNFQSSDTALHSLLMDEPRRTLRPDVELGDKSLSIRATGSVGHRASANILLNKRYAWRGYQTNGLPDRENSDSLTLIASEHDLTVGTITVGFDGPQGLLCDDLFLDKVDQIRGTGHEVCEFTKLAMDSVKRSKQTLASLFSIAHIVARRIRGADYLLVEVNPRHVSYYQRMLGFQVIGQERINRRVNAPAVLLSLDLAWSHGQIVAFDGNTACGATERSLYPYFHSQEEENRIVHTLRHHGH